VYTVLKGGERAGSGVCSSKQAIDELPRCSRCRHTVLLSLLNGENKSGCVTTMLLVEKSWSSNLTPSSRGVCQPPVSGLLAPLFHAECLISRSTPHAYCF
jgi:hypothetical protein